MASVYAVSNGQALISLFCTNHYRLRRYFGIGRPEKEVESAAKELGYIDRPTNATDMIFVGLGIYWEVSSEHLQSISAEYLLA